ncbi:hypothetical protein FKH18_24890 [Salmonella enterica]|uniref:Uncharacterized protein n=3 Tax=Salmonella enterica TaxID=28901 RepID=A0A619I4A2_SALER|nr:hypothetical protein [Salmonella enterica]EDR7785857.1 hypothetical protein [Salmonella enterica subsp. enterica serovar Java]EDV9615146.1 hypothetical protein [Salmonella enterica subsp. enterica serovar Paratyphi B]EHE8613226.1 hypothetical protein [Salmonella enterica subsp. enterica serovar 4,[5],12:b:-]EAT1859727.1 hypothetical protein [Salmonella enterica]
MLYQTTISHAANADGERVNIRTPGLRDGDLFLCEYCGSTLQLITDQGGIRRFIHTLHNNLATVKAVNCPQLPGERKRRMASPTVTGNWQCRVCHSRWYGDKRCPGCDDWVSSVPVLQQQVCRYF